MMLKSLIFRSEDFPEKSARLHWVDQVRGAAILLVMLGHTVQFSSPHNYDFFSNPLFIFIYSFHMPLFIFISGYLYKSPKFFAQSMIGKFKRLIYPVLAWGLLLQVVSIVIKSIGSGEIHGSSIPLEIIRVAKPYSFFWFLWVLFFMLVIYDLLSFIRGRFSYWAPVVVLVLLWLMPEIIGSQLKWLFPFFVAGNLLARLKSPSLRLEYIMTSISALFFIILISFWKSEDSVYIQGMRLVNGSISATAVNWTFRYAVASLGIIAAVGIVRGLTRTSRINILGQIGMVTLGIYCVQTCLFKIVASLPRLGSISIFTYTLEWPAIFVGVATVSFITAKYLGPRFKFTRKYFFGNPS